LPDDLIDRLTALESGRLPGTTPTFEPRTSLQAAWNPRTGTFQSAAVAFALEAPSVIAHQEFTQRGQSRADGKIEAPEQQHAAFDRADDGELAL
jgi:hypothetical protein